MFNWCLERERLKDVMFHVRVRPSVKMSGEDAPGRTGKKSRSSILITSAELARCGECAMCTGWHKSQEQTL